jgi:hypothetical protein
VRVKKSYIEPRRTEIPYITLKQGRLNWIGHLLGMNCLLKHVTEGMIEGRIDGKTRKKT